MTKHPKYWTAIVVVLVCAGQLSLFAQVVLPADAHGQARIRAYQFRSVDYPGSSISTIADFNGKVAVGLADGQAFYFNGTTYTVLTIPGVQAVGLTGITRLGVMVGSCGEGGTEEAFTYDGTHFVTFGFPGASTWAYGMNDSGQVVGVYVVGGTQYGYLYFNGNFTTIAYPGALQTTPQAINSAGDIVGQYSMPSGLHGFLLKNGVYSSIDFPLANGSVVNGINDAGDMVGSYAGLGGGIFLYVDGVYYQIPGVTGAQFTGLTAIKNNGDVVGVIIDVSGGIHGVIGQ
jgi:hypothetical protein